MIKATYKMYHTSTCNRTSIAGTNVLIQMYFILLCKSLSGAQSKPLIIVYNNTEVLGSCNTTLKYNKT